MSTTVLPTQPTDAERPSGRHPVNVGHLVMGIAFLGLVGVWALIQSDAVDNDDIRWLLPVPWVLAGLGGLLALGLSSRRKWSTTASTQVGWVEPEPADHLEPEPEPDLEPDPEPDPEPGPEPGPEPTTATESPEENR